MSRILVCGGRHYQNRNNVFHVLNKLYLRPPSISCIIDGMASGADTFGFEWAKLNGITSQRFPADWASYGSRAGSLRNTEMLAHGKPDSIVAFPGGNGTENMITQSTDWFIPVLNIKKDYTL